MTTFTASLIDELRAGFTGEVLLPGDRDYDDARRIWNAMIDKRPAVIARCATTSDVVRAVNFARDHGLALAVRGGGHNIAGSALSDDGMVSRRLADVQRDNRSTALPLRSASTPPPASRDSRWAADSAGSAASTA